MEHKIGEIFEREGKWYQCIEHHIADVSRCIMCCIAEAGSETLCREFGDCAGFSRKDGKNVFYVELKNIGAPTIINGKKVQLIKAEKPTMSCCFCCFCKDNKCLIPKHKHESNSFYIEIKETIMEKNNLKKFDLEAAKKGRAICTGDGRNVRILCYDLKDKDYPIAAAVEDENKEYLEAFTIEGINNLMKPDNKDNLFMRPEKKKGWVNIQKDECGNVMIIGPYKSKGEALDYVNAKTVDTITLIWEE